MPPGVPPPRKPARRQSTLDTNFAMHVQPPPQPGENFNVVFLGAGGINFGSTEGPWNHSFRLEHKLGRRLKVIALVDPSAEARSRVLKVKRDSFVEIAYHDTLEFDTLESLIKAKATLPKPHAFILGTPPAFHGSIMPGKDAEVQISNAFPGVAMFIEKPVSSAPVEEVNMCVDFLKPRGHITSVGYMLRYLKCVQKLKQILEEKNLTVMGITARYLSAYASIPKAFWWDKSLSCGPVVEQGTHFVDLMRYLGGDVDLSTVTATALEHDEPAGKLSQVPVDEEAIPPENRIPRMSSATWKFENGAIGSFVHGIVLQGTKYDTTLEVFADGYMFRLTDPYSNPALWVRTPFDDTREDCYTYKDDDPYFGEMSTFIDAVHTGDTELIASSFRDAYKTYELTWAVRTASEKSKKSVVRA